MNDNQNQEENITDELRQLGENLINAVTAAWDRPERKKLQKEIEEGLTELSQTLKNEAQSFNESPTGQQLKSDVEDLRQRVRSGEAETEVRSELLNALKTVNSELKKAVKKIQGEESPAGPDQPPEPPG
jgi:hypothetical protein